MTKTILITGATDGIGFETARLLVADGHDVLVHGRSPSKLEKAQEALSGGPGRVETLTADLSRKEDVGKLAEAVAGRSTPIDVLINNAGVFRTPDEVTADGLDTRFMVNTIAPYLLTRRLLAHIPADGRVVNLSSAAQAPVDPDALAGRKRLQPMDAYAQSKLALTIWSRELARELGETGPAIIAVNPGSLLASKMVREGFGVAGKDIGIGARILVRAATGDDFAAASGRYFDNDAGTFADPHRDALDPRSTQEVMAALAEFATRMHTPG